MEFVVNIPGYSLLGSGRPLKPWAALEPSMLSQAESEPQPIPPLSPEMATGGGVGVQHELTASQNSNQMLKRNHIKNCFRTAKNIGFKSE